MGDNFDMEAWFERFKSYPGFVRKRDLGLIREALSGADDFGWTAVGLGDDAGALRDDGGYLLLCADGLMPEYVRADPYRAGRDAVLVNVNDIYAMGGRPLAAVNILAGGDEVFMREVLRGLRDGARLWRVPMVGGHYHPDGEPSLGVAMLGRAEALLRGDGAKPGDKIVAAYDLEGTAGKGAVLTFDATAGQSGDELLRRLSALPLIAAAGWATACRDISNAGLAGTLSAMMEESGHAAALDLWAVPRPEGVELGDWLLTFPSYGFLLTVSEEWTGEVLRCFEQKSISAAVVGEVRERGQGSGVRGLRIIYYRFHSLTTDP